MTTAGSVSAGRGASLRTPQAVVLSLVGAAWLVLIAISTSPWHDDFGHQALEHLDAHRWAVATLAAGWVLMVVATMLPTSLPLYGQFRRLTEARADRDRLLAVLLGAYVGVWFVVGIAMHTGDFGVHRLVDHWPWLDGHAWTISAVTLTLAAGYEVSPLKERCATRCRTPQSFLRAHWHGASPTRGTLRIALDHALSCVGCCWALMLVMFSVGVASLPWMFVLMVVMTAEKTPGLGHRVRTPVAVWLLAGAALTVIAR
jgi:predicted metal-binding membrane protein